MSKRKNHSCDVPGVQLPDGALPLWSQNSEWVLGTQLAPMPDGRSQRPDWLCGLLNMIPSVVDMRYARDLSELQGADPADGSASSPYVEDIQPLRDNLGKGLLDAARWIRQDSEVQQALSTQYGTSVADWLMTLRAHIVEDRPFPALEGHPKWEDGWSREKEVMELVLGPVRDILALLALAPSQPQTHPEQAIGLHQPVERPATPTLKDVTANSPAPPVMDDEGQRRKRRQRRVPKDVEMAGRATMLVKLFNKEVESDTGRSQADMLKEAKVSADTFRKSSSFEDARLTWQTLAEKRKVEQGARLEQHQNRNKNQTPAGLADHLGDRDHFSSDEV